jgi:hypothetical protein
MLIHHSSCLRAAVAIHATEIEGCDMMVAKDTFECNAAIPGFGSVMSHLYGRADGLSARA